MVFTANDNDDNNNKNGKSKIPAQKSTIIVNEILKKSTTKERSKTKWQTIFSQLN